LFQLEGQAMEKQVHEYLDKIKVCVWFYYHSAFCDHMADPSRLDCFRNSQLRKQEEEFARKERERRRRKVLLEQTVAQAELEQHQQEKTLLEKLARHSKQERRIAAQ
jgi:hypothetical protein